MRLSQLPIGRARLRVLALATSVTLGLGVAVTLPAVTADASPAGAHASHSSHHKPIAMGTYQASSYAKAAAKLPVGLGVALKRDVHLTTAQYLADAAADAQAPKVVASLKTLGVHVLGSRMSGSKLTVNVASSSDVATVTAAGATAVVGAPAVHDYSTRTFAAVDSTTSYGGEGYFFFAKKGASSGSGYRCSVGFNGYSVATGAPQFVTAGHCATIIPSGNSVYMTPTPEAFAWTENDPGSDLDLGPALGTYASEGKYGSGMDYGIVSSHDAGIVSPPSIALWGGAENGSTNSVSARNVPPVGTAANPTASAGTNAPLGITGQIAATTGDTLCKSGSTSGWTCGEVLAVDQSESVSDKTVNSIIASTCLLEGDSGGGAVDGTYAIGIDSGSTFPEDFGTDASAACSDPATGPNDNNPNDNVSVFFPMVSAAGSNSVHGQQGSRWQLAVTVSTGAPTLTAPASLSPLYPYQRLTGTLSGSVAGSSDVLLYLDGSSTPVTKASVSSTGSWSIPLGSVPQGTHSYKISSGIGYSPGGSITGTLRMSEAPRIYGTDSYSTATLISKSLFPGSPSIPVLYIAHKTSFANALTAAPAAVKQGGALLLTKSTSIPSEVAAEIKRLRPKRVIVVGSTSSVSSSVLHKIAALAPGAPVSRIVGKDTYATSLAVNTHVFTATGGTVFLAKGTSYASIQSEVSAAAKNRSPVILVKGSSSSLPSATLSYLHALAPTRIILSGTSSTISNKIQAQLASRFGSSVVTRVAGANWYQTSLLIDSRFFSSSAHVAKGYLVSESSSSNNVASGVLAAATGSPVLLSEATCVKSYQISAFQSWGITQPIVIGSTSALTTSVRQFKSC